MSTGLAFSNPDAVHPPLGLYSHTAVVPAGTRLLFLSGQVGARPDGSVGATIAEQADQTFANIISLLRAHRPASTAVYVSQLVDPRWFVEVEAVVAMPG